MTKHIIIESKDDLIQYMSNSCKPREKWKIGIEQESFLFDAKTLKRVPYENGIEVLFKELEVYGWRPNLEKSKTVSLTRGKSFITLEPGGQFEFSGTPKTTVHDSIEELNVYFKELKSILSKLGFIAVGYGVDPKSERNEVPSMPKSRYEIMRPYLSIRGNLGIDMMFNTCSTQVNLDFSSEIDMVKKFRVGLAIHPIAIALFANSSVIRTFTRPFQSYRSHIWNNTDPDRCGFLPFVFEEDMGFERYVDYALDVPMLFYIRHGIYQDATGLSFKDFMKGKLRALPGELPTLQDWTTHLTTIFTEVRLKNVLEMRGADSGLQNHIHALPAFWTGLLYESEILEETLELIQDWHQDEIRSLYHLVPEFGLETPFRDKTVKEIARKCVSLSYQGLAKLENFNEQRIDERIYLAHLEKILTSGETEASRSLREFNTICKGDIDAFLRINML